MRLALHRTITTATHITATTAGPITEPDTITPHGGITRKSGTSITAGTNPSTLSFAWRLSAAPGHRLLLVELLHLVHMLGCVYQHEGDPFASPARREPPPLD